MYSPIINMFLFNILFYIGCDLFTFLQKNIITKYADDNTPCTAGDDRHNITVD